MKFILKKMILVDFKGFHNKEVEFGKYTKIKGQNGSGKTSIFTAFIWMLLDKDAELNSNPAVLPNDGRECNPTVTAICDINGKEVTLTKIQKRKKSKPDENGITKVSLSNTYFINEVPKTERDFRSHLEDMGVDFNRLLFCVHPLAFLQQKTTEMRKMLFSMASEKTDLDIAEMDDSTQSAAELLKSYKFEEVEAMQKASKKKADEQIKSIPELIKGMELSKVNIDTAEQELAKNDLEQKIAEIDSKIKNADSGINDLMSESMDLQFDLSGIMQNMNQEIFEKRRKVDTSIYETANCWKDLMTKISDAERTISSNKEKISNANRERSELVAQYRTELAKEFDAAPYKFDESGWVFDESSTVCSLCGQTLPAEKIEELKKEFEIKKHKASQDAECRKNEAKLQFDTREKVRVEQIKQDGFAQKKIIDDSSDENVDLEKKISGWKSQAEKLLRQVHDLEKQLSELPEEADYSTNDEYNAKRARLAEIETKIASLKESATVKESLENERNALSIELDKVKEMIAQAINNVRIDEQIEMLQEKQLDYEQAKADAEKILYQLSLISKKKNEVFSEEINSKFDAVRWTFFDYQKNGEYKETCIPTVDGFRFGESTNTGREIIAKLDICNSLQRFYGTELPIFLDGAESLNDWNLPQINCQLVTLCVTGDKELKVEGI